MLLQSVQDDQPRSRPCALNPHMSSAPWNRRKKVCKEKRHYARWAKPIEGGGARSSARSIKVSGFVSKAISLYHNYGVFIGNQAQKAIVEA